jgi:hypothetical protein
MNRHELDYCRFLVTEIKRLLVESQAKSVLLDSWTMQANRRNANDWRPEVQTMVSDEVFCSGVEANLSPYVSRLHRALMDASALQELMRD